MTEVTEHAHKQAIVIGARSLETSPVPESWGHLTLAAKLGHKDPALSLFYRWENWGSKTKCPVGVHIPSNNRPWPQLQVCFPLRPVTFPSGSPGIMTPTTWISLTQAAPPTSSHPSASHSCPAGRGESFPGREASPELFIRQLLLSVQICFLICFLFVFSSGEGGRHGGASAFSESSVFISPSVVWGF